MTTSAIYIIGTFDTKAAELFFAVQCVQNAGARAITVDVSTSPSSAACDVSAVDVARHHPSGSSAVLALTDRGAAVSAMAIALTAFMQTQLNIGAVLGLGGSGNTAIVTAAMRALPIGIPKIMVSTLASGNIAQYVGPSDIMMMHSVADIAGLNDITRAVIGNAAHAACGMALNPIKKVQQTKRPIGLTMFGVTTHAITAIRKLIEDDAECFVFHATGTGGQCLEKLIDSGFLSGAIDLTTTEVADYLFGGILPCTADRFGAIIRKQIPYIGSVGALDMVNFGPLETIPSHYRDRKFHLHNSAVTLMRTTPDENAAMGKWIIERINQMQGPVQFFLPLKGISAIDLAGQIFYDPVADAALFDAIRQTWRTAPNRKLIEIEAHINEPVFAQKIAENYRNLML